MISNLSDGTIIRCDESDHGACAECTRNEAVPVTFDVGMRNGDLRRHPLPVITPVHADLFTGFGISRFEGCEQRRGDHGDEDDDYHRDGTEDQSIGIHIDLTCASCNKEGQMFQNESGYIVLIKHIHKISEK